MTTGTNIQSGLPFRTGLVSNEMALRAINFAIGAAWPHIKINQYAVSAGTFASQTYEYSLSALTDLPEQYGIAQVFIHPNVSTDSPKFPTRAWSQRRDDSTWTLKFRASVVETFAGRDFDVAYQAKPSELAALGDTLDEELSRDYMVAATAHFCCLELASTQTTSQRVYLNLAVDWKDKQEKALRGAHVGALPRAYYEQSERWQT